MNIVSVHGYSKEHPAHGKIIFDSSEFLLAHEIDNGRTIIWLKHNVSDKEGAYTPLWIVCEESANNLTKQMKDNEKQ